MGHAGAGRLEVRIHLSTDVGQGVEHAKEHDTVAQLGGEAGDMGQYIE
jgi:hypothetical protein